MPSYDLYPIDDGDIYDGVAAWDGNGDIVNTYNPTLLRVGEQPDDVDIKKRYRSVLRFHIGAVPPGFTINRARLYLYYSHSYGDDIPDAAPDSGDVGHVIVDHLGGIGAVSADDFQAVALDANIGTLVPNDTAPTGWYYLDVTSYVAADFLISASTNFRLQQSTEGAYGACSTFNIWYFTSSKGGMRKPYLEVVYSTEASESSFSSYSYSLSSSSSSSSSSSFSSSSSESSSSFSYSLVWADDARVVPSTFRSGDTICAHYDYHGSYPEADSILRWYKNGAWQKQFDGIVCFVVTGVRGDTWYFTITPCDGFHYGDTVISAPGVMINNPPSAPTYVEIIPHNPQLTDDLTGFFGGSIDPDGDRVAYRTYWYRNDIEMVGYRNRTVIPYTELSVGDRFKLVVIATDGTDDSA